MSKSIVCTLYEGSYQFGVAALVNSLHKQDFRGEVYVGYRGDLPGWAKKNDNRNDTTAKLKVKVADDLDVIFIYLDTDYHFTHYKPNFILQLFNEIKDVDAIFYFDPDIVIKCHWKHFEKWVNHGVALVHEIVSNDMPANHPLRAEWREVIKKAEKEPVRELDSYINGGFCGVKRANMEFIKNWLHIMNIARNHFGLCIKTFMPSDRTDIFLAGDQDALNIAAMCTNVPISEVGPEGMDFIHGGIYMSHAVGKMKPWMKSYLLESFKGNPPSLADKTYWENVSYPLDIYRSTEFSYKRLTLKTASFLGRFYRKY